MVYRRRLGVFVKMEAETRRTEFLFAEIACGRVELAQRGATVVAESASRTTTGRTQRIFQVPVPDDSAIVVVHCRETIALEALLNLPGASPLERARRSNAMDFLA